MTDKLEVTELGEESGSSIPVEESQPPIVVVASDSEDSASENSGSGECTYRNKRPRYEGDTNSRRLDIENKLVNAITELTSVQKGILETLQEISNKISGTKPSNAHNTVDSLEINKTSENERKEESHENEKSSDHNGQNTSEKIQGNGAEADQKEEDKKN